MKRAIARQAIHTEPDGPRGTQSIHRAVALLREISHRLRAGWTLTDLAAQCGLDRSTAHRILACLVAEGLVVRHPVHRRYVLGPLAFELGLAAAPRFDLRTLCAPVLQRLADRIGDTVFLNTRSGNDSVCIDRREGDYPIKALAVEIGARRPLVASAGGVAMLLALPESERAAIVQANVSKLSGTARARVSDIHRMLKRSAVAGYAVNEDDIIPGVTAIGMPIALPSGEPVAAISIAAVSERLRERRRKEALALLRAAAAEVSGLLSGRAPL